MNQKILEAIVAMFASGDPELQDAAIKYISGIKRVDANGVPRHRKRRTFWTPEMLEPAKQMRARGKSWDYIGRKLGVSGACARRHAL